MQRKRGQFAPSRANEDGNSDGASAQGMDHGNLMSSGNEAMYLNFTFVLFSIGFFYVKLFEFGLNPWPISVLDVKIQFEFQFEVESSGLNFNDISPGFSVDLQL